MTYILIKIEIFCETENYIFVNVSSSLNSKKNYIKNLLIYICHKNYACEIKPDLTPVYNYGLYISNND